MHMYLVLGLGHFYMNYCLSMAWMLLACGTAEVLWKTKKFQ